MATRRKAEATSTSPTAQRWELARRLKELRVQHGRSLEDVARELMCSTAKVSRMETAARGIQRRDIRDLSRYYKVPAKIERELMTLAEEAGQPGWWAEYRTLTEDHAKYIGLESAAVTVWSSQTALVPGLLQTEEYTTHLLKGIGTSGGLSPEAQAEQVAIRRHRQERILDGTLTLHALVDEAALQRQIGPPPTMTHQIERLIELAHLPNVHIQVIPNSAGAHPGLYGAFQYLRFAPDALPDVVSIEGPPGVFVLERAADVQRYREICDELETRHALPPDATLAWLEEAANQAKAS